MSGRKNREEIIQLLQFPIFIHSEHDMRNFENPKDFLWCLRRNFEWGVFDNCEVIDSRGERFYLTHSQLEKLSVRNVFDVLNFYHKKWWPYKISACVEQLEAINLEDFKKEKIDFVMKYKWYGSSDPATTKTEKLSAVGDVKRAETFEQAFASLFDMMSWQQRRRLYEL